MPAAKKPGCLGSLGCLGCLGSLGCPFPLIHAGLDRSMGVGRSGAQRARRRWPHEPRENFFQKSKTHWVYFHLLHLHHRSICTTVPSASTDRLITC